MQFSKDNGNEDVVVNAASLITQSSLTGKDAEWK